MSDPTKALEDSLKLLRHIRHSCAAENFSFALNSDNAIDISGMTVAGGMVAPSTARLLPDAYKAYVEFYLSHAFPAVIPSFGTGIHPQVVGNSYLSMLHQVFDLNHFVKAYDPEQNPRDRILGSIIAVEYPRAPMGGWTVQADKAKAPSIRCVAVMSKAAEGVDRIIGQHQSGRRTWSVSMENAYFIEDGGFLVKTVRGNTSAGVSALLEQTPKDISDLGWVYVPWNEASAGLRACFDGKKIISQLDGQDVIYMLGGLDGIISYRGVGLTPLGREKEAEITTMLASATNEPAEAIEMSLKMLEAAAAHKL